MRVGTKVKFLYQGKKKSGIICKIVGASVEPLGDLPLRQFLAVNKARDHESYVVQAGLYFYFPALIDFV